MIPEVHTPATITTDHVLGKRTAPVTLVEYGDYQCPYCGRAYRVLREVRKRVGEQFRFVYRHFPLTRIHPHALLAAQAAEAAGAQGEFWGMHVALYEHQDALSVDDLVAYADALDLDVERFRHDLHAGTYTPRILHDMQVGGQVGVTGTPTFFVGGRIIESGWAPDTLVDEIRRAAYLDETYSRRSLS
jgi:protein-disulfide isomerase